MTRLFLGLSAALCLFATLSPTAVRAAESERPATVKVAAVQCPSDLGDIPGNSRRLTTLIEIAAREGAKIVVLPEAAVTGYLSQDLKTNWHFWIIGANWSVDHAQKWRGYGFSSIISPAGEVEATAKSLYGNEIVYATIPTQKPASAK